MSRSCDEYYAVYNEARRRARKPHACSACKETIRAGDVYTHVSIVFDGKAETVKRCLRCQEIHDHLKEKGYQSEMWPDERLNCGEEYTAHWGHAPPEEIAALAFMTPDEIQARAKGAHNPQQPKGDPNG